MRKRYNKAKPARFGSIVFIYQHIGSSRLKHLTLYFVYIGVVLAVGAKLGAFDRHSTPPSKLRTISALSSSKTQERPVPLPQGMLAFDAEFRQTTIHAGDSQAHFVLNFSNISSKAIIISSVRSSCGCTTAELPPMPWTLVPRAKGQIPVNMNVQYRTGKSTKTVTVTTLKGDKTLTVEADILPRPTEGATNNDHS